MINSRVMKISSIQMIVLGSKVTNKIFISKLRIFQLDSALKIRIIWNYLEHKIDRLFSKNKIRVALPDINNLKIRKTLIMKTNKL